MGKGEKLNRLYANKVFTFSLLLLFHIKRRNTLKIREDADADASAELLFRVCI